MITFLDGILEEKQATRIVLHVGGVGYEVFVPLTTYEKLPVLGASCRVLVYDYIRDDAHSLYGFIKEHDRKMFILLLGIAGIGPKIALSALSALSVRELTAAAAARDISRLSSISGVGKKMAERIAIELGHKISDGDALEAAAGMEGSTSVDSRLRDAVLALISLGYKQADAQKLARDAIARADPCAGVEDLVRLALTKGKSTAKQDA